MEEHNGQFKVIFRGIRGSYPVSSPDFIKYGGNTSCVEIRVNGYSVILDAGTGIIKVGNELVREYLSSGSSNDNRTPVKAVLLFSHAHHDHIQGFPFFKPVYINSSKVHMYGTMSVGLNFKDVMTQSMCSAFFPLDLNELAANIEINNIKDTDTIILHPDYEEPKLIKIKSNDKYLIPEDAVVITCLKSYAHPKDGVMIYKIKYKGKSVVYATDKESYIGGDLKLIAFASHTDVLIHDAQYTQEEYSSPIMPKQGFGHSTPEMAIETARLCNAKKLVLYHLDPSYDDNFIERIEQNAIKQFKNACVAHEGLEIDLL
ncbi:MAG: MBL fold metallo-hydrolase [bacterium]